MKNRLTAFALTSMSFTLVLANAQQLSAPIQALLPPGAAIVETSDLTAAIAKPRVMVLWMLDPQRNLDDRANKNREGGYCSDIRSGDFGKYWEGPTRLSLLDPQSRQIINTIEIKAGCDTCGDSLQIPLCVRTSTSDSQGRPNLDLRDLTGEGIKTDFALDQFEAFNLLATGAFGYDPKSDRVVQYAIEIDGADKPTLWTDEVFAREPVRPGYWDFTWAPGHGDDSTYHVEVSFDRAKRIFQVKMSR